MLNNRLPLYFDPRKYASSQVELEGKMQVGQFKALCEVLASDAGDVSIHLKFKVDEGCYVVTGTLKSQVQVICQRCMQPAPYEIDAQISVAFAYDEEHAKSLPVDYDPVVMKDGEVVLAEMVEEELILALPVVAYHAENDCNPHALKYASSTDEAADDGEKPNPFSVLAQLKAK